MGWRVGIDTGGTFTDLVAVRGKDLRIVKVPSTPPDFETGIVNSIISAGLKLDEIDEIAHGTTVATNAIITGETGSTALLTTYGFRDVLQLGRHNRGEPFDIMWDPPAPVVPRRLRYEVRERIAYSGAILQPLNAHEVKEIVHEASRDDVQSFAICFLHSYANPSHEESAHEIVAALRPDAFVCHSAQLLREPPEFERTSTTVINAALMPVVARYLRALQMRLHDSGFRGELSVMHSGGGLMTVEGAAQFPARLVTSGPAAGAKAAEGISRVIPAATGSPAGTVVMAERLAHEEGLDRLISLDIGGTSADIALVRDGKARIVTEFSPQFGQPIRFPAIDLLTIGAGGGSIAWVDAGGLPHVGPQSAGARPGPASYGNGGDLPTVTDANVVLGRLSSDQELAGGIRLDASAARDAVAKFADQLELGIDAAALGILEICNNNMAKSIRVITVNRGLDPRDFCLVPFGGGGGLQAVDLAEILGIRKIVIPIAPGVTSGLGCLHVGIVHDSSEALIAPLSELKLDLINQVLNRLESSMIDKLTVDGVASEDQRIEFSADVRYLGQVRGLTLPINGSHVDENFAEMMTNYFYAEYERQFHSHTRDIVVELAALRVQGRKPIRPPEIPFRVSAGGIGIMHRTVTTKAGRVVARVVDRKTLAPGTSLSGPLVITQEDSTTWVPQPWTVDVNPIGNLLLTHEGGMEMTVSLSTAGGLRRRDPILFQVLNSAFSSITDEMGALIRRAAFSLVVSEGSDYSGTISNRHGDLIASGATDLAAHLGTVPFSVKGTLDWIGVSPSEYFKPGDVVLLNDPYIGGTHHNDMRAIMPVFFDGEIAAFIQNSAHWTDIGGHVPGTFDPNALSSYGEGLAVPPIHIVKEGIFQSEVADLILRNVRLADQARGDLLTQIGVVRLGVRRMEELSRRYGAPTIVQAMDELIEYSEALLREEFRKLPDGSWDVEALIDRDPGSDRDDPLPVRMTLRIQGDQATMDFSASAGPARGAVNSTEAVTISGAVTTLKMIYPHVPMNQGVFRAVNFVLPSSTLLSAKFPAPVSGCAAGVYPAVGDCVLKAFIQLVPDRCMAGPTGLLNMVMGGADSRPGHDGEDFVMYLWLEGGWGGRPGRKDNSVAMTTFATTSTNQPVELQERLYPVLFDCYRIEQDSAGAGWHRGGPGVTRRWSFPYTDVVLSALGDGERFGPWGWAGGSDARPNRFVADPGTDREFNVGMYRTNLMVPAGTMLDCFQPGGGGFGDPMTRPVEYVLEDVVDGLVSIAGAALEYGVVCEFEPVTQNCVLNSSDTESLRYEKRGNEE